MPHPNPTTPSPAPRRATLASALALPALLLAGLPARADWALNMPVGVTPVSREVYDLHMLILWICTIIAVGTFGAMAYALVAFRRSKGAVADTNMTHSTAAEIIWTVIPVVILVFMAFQAAPALIRIEDTRNSEMTVKITGYQWKWEYEYLNEGVSLFSSLAADSNAARRKNAGIDPRSVENYLLEVDEPLVVPAGVKIRYLITANDVLHAWWVPDFAVKRDAIPGYVNEGWFQVDEPGIYRGQCAELCGKDHGFMPVVVKVVPKAEFDAWLAARKAPAAVAAAN
jgi:cytochrome c oxidase subunit 2